MRKIVCLCLIFLYACAGPSHATLASPPVALNIALTPALRPYSETLHACTAAQSSFVLNVFELPAPALDIRTTDLVIRLGGTPGNGFAAPVGTETIVLIVNASNPVLTIATDKISALFSGRVTSWADLGGGQQLIQVWVYPDGDDAREILDAAILQDETLTPNALIAPNPQAMLEAVGDDPQAIGYVPQTWLNTAEDSTKIHSLDLNQKLVDVLHQPVLAITRLEPQGSLRLLLACLQSSRH
jgi:hypothetical protein